MRRGLQAPGVAKAGLAQLTGFVLGRSFKPDPDPDRPNAGVCGDGLGADSVPALAVNRDMRAGFRLIVDEETAA
jgi:hypothetical protein